MIRNTAAVGTVLISGWPPDFEVTITGRSAEAMPINDIKASREPILTALERGLLKGVGYVHLGPSKLAAIFLIRWAPPGTCLPYKNGL